MPTPPVSDDLLTETVAAYLSSGKNQCHTALALGLSRSAVQVRLMRAAERGMLGPAETLPGFAIKSLSRKEGDAWVTQTKAPGPVFEVPEGFTHKRISALTNAAGETTARWDIVEPTQQAKVDAIKAVYAALIEDMPRAEAAKPPASVSTDLLNQYTVTDLHFGMLSWREESGADYDIAIAEKLLLDWFSAAIDLAPNAHTAVLAQLGDLLHHDGHESVTPAHRNVLDADSRLQKVIRVVIRTMRRVIGMLLEKHQHVHIIMADANHDPASGAWLREMFAAFYEDEPRVSVDSTASTYYCYEWGDTSLFFHHGHKRKIADVDSVFAGKWREVYGRTKHSYAHLGHLHSDELKSTNLMKVERHETLAAPDAYSANGGWLSGRSAKVITYHRRLGEVFRSTLSPEMVAGLAA